MNEIIQVFKIGLKFKIMLDTDDFELKKKHPIRKKTQLVYLIFVHSFFRLLIWSKISKVK